MSVESIDGALARSGRGTSLKVAFRRLGDGVVVAVGGELDMGTADELGRVLDEAVLDVAAGTVVSVDLSRVPFMDSWGFEPLVRTATRCASKGAVLELVEPTAQVRRLVEMLGRTDLVAEGQGPMDRR